MNVPSRAEFGLVVDQDPEPGVETDRGSTVTLEVSRGPGNVNVPSVDGLTQERAIKELNKAGLRAISDSEPSDTVKRGFAIRTVPKGGAEVERGTQVRLFVSSGPEKVTVPNVVGLTRSSAQDRLEGESLDVAVREENSERPKDEVIAQDPVAGTKLDKNARVTITVSKGPEKVDVPDVTGLSAGDAARQLRQAGLDPVTRERRVASQDEDGNVIDQRPAGGSELEKGREVVIVVGRFEQPTTPPGQTQP